MRRRGFSLLEMLVALVLVGVALLLALGTTFAISRAAGRMAAHREAVTALEAVHERFRRGGTAPVGLDGEVDLSLLSLPSPEEAQGLTVEAEVSRDTTDPPSLYRLRLTARYEALGNPVERHLDTWLYRP